MSFNVRIYFENSSVGFPPQRPRSCGGCHSFLLCLKDLPTPLTDPVLGFMLGKQVLTPSLGSEGKVRGVHTCVCVFTCAHVCMWMCVHMHMCVLRPVVSIRRPERMGENFSLDTGLETQRSALSDGSASSSLGGRRLSPQHLHSHLAWPHFQEGCACPSGFFLGETRGRLWRLELQRAKHSSGLWEASHLVCHVFYWLVPLVTAQMWSRVDEIPRCEEVRSRQSKDPRPFCVAVTRRVLTKVHADRCEPVPGVCGCVWSPSWGLGDDQ